MAAGIGRQTWYDWQQSDPAFKAMVDEAKEEVADQWERELAARGKGREASDTLLMFALRALRPHVYRDRQEVTVLHPDVKVRLERQVALIAGRATWDSAELLEALGTQIWK